MSNTCQKNFALTIGATPPHGPPDGPLQVDGATVSQQNAWDAKFHAEGCPSPTAWTGLLSFSGFSTWIGDSGRSVVMGSPGNWSLSYQIYCGAIQQGTANYVSTGSDPTGVYTISGHTPPGNISFADGSNLPNWFPTPPTTVSVAWA